MENFVFNYTDQFNRNWKIDSSFSIDAIVNLGYDIDKIKEALIGICNGFIADALSCGSRYIYLLFDDNNDIYVRGIRYKILRGDDGKRYINEINAYLKIITPEEREKEEREREENERKAIELRIAEERQRKEYEEFISKYISIKFRPKYEYKHKHKYKSGVHLLRWQNNDGSVSPHYYFGGLTNIKRLTDKFNSLVDNVLTEEDINFIANHSMYGEAYYYAMKNVNRHTDHKKMINKPQYKDIVREFRNILNKYLRKGVELDPFIVAIFDTGLRRS